VDYTVKSDLTVRDFMFREREVVLALRTKAAQNLTRHGIPLIHGTASFEDPHTIRVRSDDHSDRLVRGDVILIATGSSPARPSNVPFDGETVLDSDNMLTIDRLPESLAVVGAGVIGCEYASIFAALGVEVHLVDGRTSLLPHVDREIVRVLLGELQNRLGITLHLGCDVDVIDRVDGRVSLLMKDGTCFVVDKVLYAAGRSSNVEGLNLDGIGVATGKRGPAFQAIGEERKRGRPRCLGVCPGPRREGGGRSPLGRLRHELAAGFEHRVHFRD
jgi:NAD(P) transhydrogenase